MVELAASKGLVLAEAMTIWHMPLLQELWRRTQAGDFGRAQMITLNFGSFKPYDMKNRFFNRNLAGGALLDIGVYALSFARSFMDACPTKILSQMLPCETGVDEQASILLQNDSGQMATVALSLHSKQPKRAVVSFDRGYLEIMEYPRCDKAIWVDAQTGSAEEIAVGAREQALYYEMTDMEEAIVTGNPRKMLLPYTQDVMAIMTQLRASWGLTYPEEE
jgi:predicted dehydrogenase